MCAILLPSEPVSLTAAFFADQIMDGRPHSKLASIQHLDQDDRDWLLQEANLVAMHLSVVQSKLNSFLPVYCLPKELVIHIFEILASSASTSSRWIHVTHVCRHWRNIALSTPTLWRQILTSPGPEFATVCLERSGNDVPLEIFWRNKHAHAPSHFPALFNEAAQRRVVVQDVEVLGPFLRSYALDCVKRCTNLQVLSLRAPGRLNSAIRPASTSMSFLDLTSLVTPEKLTYLQMRFIIPSPPTSIGLCTNLRTLRLVRYMHTRALRLIDLLQVLDSCTLLQHLFLGDAGPRTSVEPALENLPYDVRRKVKMNHLQSLALALTSGRYIAHLLASLVMPHDTRIHLQNNSGSDDNGPFPLLLPTGDLSDLHFIKTLRRLELSLRHGTELHAKAYHDDVNFVLEANGSLTPRLQIISATNVKNALTFDELSKIFRHAYVETLSLEANLLEKFHPCVHWKQFLRCFSKIKTLQVSFRTQRLFSFEFEDYLKTLMSPFTSTDSQVNAPAVALPALESLHLAFFKKYEARRLRQELVAYARLCQSRLPEGRSFRLVVNGKIWKIPKVCVTVVSGVQFLNTKYYRNAEGVPFCHLLIQPSGILVRLWQSPSRNRGSDNT